MKKLLFALTATAAMAMVANANAADKFKACWVYTGPIGDFG
jgi:simple sugar transport system substrate-binding protein